MASLSTYPVRSTYKQSPFGPLVQSITKYQIPIGAGIHGRPREKELAVAAKVAGEACSLHGIPSRFLVVAWETCTREMLLSHATQYSLSYFPISATGHRPLDSRACVWRGAVLRVGRGGHS